MDENFTGKLSNYHPSTYTIDLIRQTPILFLVGPTGAGKDSLKDKLLATGHYHHIVSHTSRQPRINHGIPEQSGREYHFIDIPAAERMLDQQAFVEAKTYSGNLYGTSVSEIQLAHDEGKIAITDIEVQGVAEYKALDPNVMAAFLLPPSFEVWQQRLKRRYGDVVDASDHRLRLETALEEIEELLNTDYYAAFVNDDMETTFQALEKYAHSGHVDEEVDKTAREVALELAEHIQEFLSESV